MAELGGFGDLPYELGGMPSPEERAYAALRSLVGEGLPAVDDYEVTTIDGTWRAAKACGLAAFDSVDEAAHWQGFPHTASDLLSEYERVLGIVAGLNASEEERRQEVVRRWTLQVTANYPGLDLKVAAIDARASMLQPNHTLAATTVAGKVYDPHAAAGGTFDSARRCSNFPNYSDDYVMSALLDVGEGNPPDDEIGRSMSSIESLLDATIPAWNDFRVVLDVGFILDGSLLDVTGFGS